MKKPPLKAILFLVVVLFAAQMTQAQGTLYVSDLGQSSIGGNPIGADTWVAEFFETGNNSSGYILNSVQLPIDTATGNPSGFNVWIYSAVNFSPSSDLANLTGSSNPSTAGLYTYSASSLILAPSTEYFIVATAATPEAQGAYPWAETLSGVDFTGIDQWKLQGFLFSSDAGLDWYGVRDGFMQTAIFATAIPEPSTWILCLLGGGFAFYLHARNRREEVDQLENGFSR